LLVPSVHFFSHRSLPNKPTLAAPPSAGGRAQLSAAPMVHEHGKKRKKEREEGRGESGERNRRERARRKLLATREKRKSEVGGARRAPSDPRTSTREARTSRRSDAIQIVLRFISSSVSSQRLKCEKEKEEEGERESNSRSESLSLLPRACEKKKKQRNSLPSSLFFLTSPPLLSRLPIL